jgi:hypothetical protein
MAEKCLHSCVLPGTIRDAITVAQELGERYLWVDSLCIQQDDVSEQKVQISLMDWVYGHAALTIVAADAPNADTGLKGVQEGSRKLAQLKAELRPGEHIIIPLLEPIAIESSIWNSRAVKPSRSKT